MSDNDDDKVRVTHELDGNLIDRLEGRAAQPGISRDALVTRSVSGYIEATKRGYAGETREEILERAIKWGLNRIN